MSGLGAGTTMKISSKVKSDQSAINNLMKRLKALDEREVEYGYYESDQHPSGKSMAEIAAINNYGDDEQNIPARPFMEQTVDYVTQRYEVDNSWKKDLWQYFCYGGGVLPFLNKQAAEYGVDSIQVVMNRQDFEDNVAWWEKAKQSKYGFTQILWETGALYDGAKTKVVKKTRDT